MGFPDSSVGKESACNAGDPHFNSWVGNICWRRNRLPTPVFLGFPCGLADKKSACSVGDLGSIPGLVRSPGEGKGYPFQYSGLENSMDCTEWLVPSTHLSEICAKNTKETHKHVEYQIKMILSRTVIKDYSFKTYTFMQHQLRKNTWVF